MTPELTVLALLGLWHAVTLSAYAVAANLQVGTGYALSSRDEARRLTGLAGRLQRALQNGTEALVFFAPAALIVAVTGQSTGVTAACAWAVLGARILYLPAYGLGLVPGRSLVWAVGFLATLALYIAALT